ncbi:MAG: SDR family NAD(P)-dependent oxidoreductase [Anaerolineae bacterium]
MSPLVPLAQHPLDALEDVYRANVIAPLALVQEALPLLKASHGLVVNVSSDAARGGYLGRLCGSKAALDLIADAGERASRRRRGGRQRRSG